MKTKTETFWKFLSENEIEVPLIQRDYAQGRKGKEQLRKSFLSDVKKSLDEEDNPLTLDFVYGKKTGAVVMPLDGQQRLTTLWLLHWYLAYRSDSLKPEVISVLKKFRYASRISSRDFCERLSVFSVLPTSGESIKKHIEDQTWFRRQWRNDPTVQAMLGMLAGHLEDGSDGIEKIFGCNYGDCVSKKECPYTRYWNKLTGDGCPISFYYLDLPGLKQTDSLYIKMNARGKPLTSFENFKADLIDFIHKKTEDEKNKKDNGVCADWGRLADPIEGFSIKLDTDWTNNIFWPLRIRKGTDNDVHDGLWDGRVDDIIFAFFNRFCANVRALSMIGEAKYGDDPIFDAFYGRYLERNGKDQRDDSRIAYTDFNNYQAVLGKLQCIEAIGRIFDAYGKQFESHTRFESYTRYGTTYVFIPHYKVKGTNARFTDFAGTEIPQIESIEQKERIIFFAFCQFFANDKLPLDETQRTRAFKSWMRVTVNIVENSNVNTISSMNGCLKLIDELSGHAHDILYYLKTRPRANCGTEKGQIQIAEEIEKACKIIDDQGSLAMYNGSISDFHGKTWEDVIDEVEQFTFFNGSIRFLFRDGAGNVDWSSFDIKWNNVKRYFDDNGVREEYRKSAVLLRAFLARIDSSNIDWFGNGRKFWRDQVLLNDDRESVVAELLSITDLSEANVIPKTIGVADWICDKTLLEDAISRGGSADAQWHIVYNWRGCKKTLTQYTRKEKGNVNYPAQIIPLDLKRNELMASMESDQKRGERYYIGWNSNIDFKYNGSCFRWYGAPDYSKGEVDVYLMILGDYQRRPGFDETGKRDVDNYYCFDARVVESQDVFKRKLEELITAFAADSEKR